MTLSPQSPAPKRTALGCGLILRTLVYRHYVTIMQTIKPDNRPFGGRIREERLRLSLSQARLAQLAGVSKTSQVNYEANVYVPDINYLAAISRVGVDPIFVLLGGAPAKYIAANFNWTLANQILELIDEWATGRSVHPPASVRGRLFELLYKQSCVDGDVDSEAVVELLKLAS